MSFEVKEILALPPEEKKRIADLIYESLVSYNNSNNANEPIQEWQKTILDERIADLKKYPESFLNWEETKIELDNFYEELRNKKTGS